MKVLLVGDGARENVLAYSLARSSKGYKIYALSSYINPGINSIVKTTGAEYFIGNVNSPEVIKEVIKKVNPDLGVIGPEDPLFNGIADIFRKEGISVFGASKKCARIEESKAWARELMWKHSIPGRLRYKVFYTIEDTAKFILEYGGSVAIKPAGQAGGKGVKVIADLEAYLTHDKREALTKSVNEIGSLYNKEGEPRIIIEEKVDGPEYTLHVLSDGKTTISLPLAQDYKNAYQDGIGPETGGMGSISGPNELLPFISNEEYQTTYDIVKRTMDAIYKETGERYVGVIAGQMMLTELWGPTVIEYYSRFGDPEASAIIPRLESDFGETIELTATGHLNKASIKINEKPSIVRAVATLGYPISKQMASGHKIVVDLEKMKERGCVVFFGSVALEGMQLITKGSRALEIVAIGDFEEAAENLDRCMQYISSDTKLIYRTDIGRTVKSQIEKAEIIRYSYKNREKRGILGVSADWSPNGGLW
ncbi:phosphoribosylamine--glycine ligase [Saccharolobus solfataricus]|nr:phosphoribosylamine--glycine ligase [Saccharolobus solfataricus]AKA75080.1 phosphoribosylamine--glycine ligase [Saccharolobus solfataricus]AKA77774.1 phosphoribosylamine--glycine ligase [Saccharolobus solfataricus]AKA80466.1 phosphoribosylamine--glycine ligase [Saccharolobus solfataricus]AZF69526.1 phosphoribosylamine--glycine ligase [Saccharolobus solfataricus]AZF72146.1 phosphoribosylamine--glycine ligase [Saccharolobus solfataricus]